MKILILDSDKATSDQLGDLLASAGYRVSTAASGIEALLASGARFRSLAEQSVAGIYVIVGDRFKYANPTLAGIFGYTPDEMMNGLGPLDLVAKPDKARIAKSIKQRIEGVITTAHYTWQGIRKDGQLVTVESYGTRIDWDGQPAVMDTVLDITERARAQEATAGVAREWETTFNSTNDAIWILDKDQRVLRANKTTETALGIPCSALVGRRCYEVLHNLPAPCQDCVHLRCLKSGHRESTEMRVGKGDWFEVVADPIRDESGQIVGAVHIMSSVTERKRIENEIRESEERYRMLVEESPDGIGIFQDGQLVFINSSGARNLGYNSRHDMYGLRTAQLIHPHDLPAAMDRLKRRLAGNTGVYPAEVSYLRRDGTSVPVEVVASPIVFGGKPAVQFIARDITERKRAEAEREKLQDQLLESQKMESVGRLAGGVAHDFNNMLQAIFGYVSLAIEDLPPGSATHEYILQIQHVATRAAGLTRQLVAFARKQAIRPVVLDLNATVDNTLRMLRSLIGEDIQLDWLPGRDLWHVKVDPTQLDQVLANLTINARDAIKATGKLTIETCNAVLDDAYVAAYPECMPGQYVMLAVSDTGCGMDKETLSHLFEPFYTTKEPGKGSGLGLATVFGIVKQNKGIINVYSEPGQGTTFKIYLPRAECKPAPPSHEPKCDPPHGNESVLLVEDEPQILNVSKRFLEGLGYKVLAVQTPAAALDVVAHHKEQIHLLVTDVVLPGMNGKDLQQKLAAIQPHMKYIFMSGYTADAIVKHGVLEEGISFLQKPFTVDDLAHKIREVLDRPPGS